jgi:beta-lactam-binding protein with PASTA domain
VSIAASADGEVAMPDLRGLGAREALRALSKLGVTIRLTGDGFVVEQEPTAGAPLENGASSRLWLERTARGAGPGMQP